MDTRLQPIIRSRSSTLFISLIGEYLEGRCSSEIVGEPFFIENVLEYFGQYYPGDMSLRSPRGVWLVFDSEITQSSDHSDSLVFSAQLQRIRENSVRFDPTGAVIPLSGIAIEQYGRFSLNRVELTLENFDRVPDESIAENLVYMLNEDGLVPAADAQLRVTVRRRDLDRYSDDLAREPLDGLTALLIVSESGSPLTLGGFDPINDYESQATVKLRVPGWSFFSVSAVLSSVVREVLSKFPTPLIGLDIERI